ncbi:MAG: rubrerythrin [Clostridiales bacterium]|nr:rubrerythrin [Clostridiales bacterium]
MEGIGSTIDNLKAAAAGENGEWTDMYPRMAREAREEGFNHITEIFEGIARIEKEHEERYKKLLQNIENGTAFKKEHSVKWKCRNCGHIHEGPEAPETCPVCAHPQAFFEILCANY